MIIIIYNNDNNDYNNDNINNNYNSSDYNNDNINNIKIQISIIIIMKHTYSKILNKITL